jgi:hypothetical protein
MDSPVAANVVALNPTEKQSRVIVVSSFFIFLVCTLVSKSINNFSEFRRENGSPRFLDFASNVFIYSDPDPEDTTYIFYLGIAMEALIMVTTISKEEFQWIIMIKRGKVLIMDAAQLLMALVAETLPV